MSKFTIRDLGVLMYSNGFTLWHFKAGATPLSEVATPNFFADAGDMMAVGDMIMVSGERGATIRVVSNAAVNTVHTAAVY